MKLIDALNWRYATKRMTGTKIPDETMEYILNAISLAPSSFGLQPYSVIVIENKELLQKIQPIAAMQAQITDVSALLVFAAWDNLTEERINEFIHRISEVREVSEDSLKPIREMVITQLENSAANNFNWNTKQVYIALGIGLVAAAEAYIDSTPMEGFDNVKMDELLELKAKGLRSVVLLALGYRDTEKDYLVKLKKVRRKKEDLFRIVK
jgi:nitroreductase